MTLKSRKFKATLAAALTAVAGGLTGEVSWDKVIYSVVAACIGYAYSVAVEDAGKK